MSKSLISVSLFVTASLAFSQYGRIQRLLQGSSGKRVRTARASAPGKVLIVGGYLILEEPNKGLVLTTSSRFHSSLSLNPSSSFSSSSSFSIRISSPQFHSSFLYNISYIHQEAVSKLDVPVQALKIESCQEHPFFERSLSLFFLYLLNGAEDPQQTFHAIVQSLQGQEVAIVVEADNDFYSQLDWLQQHNLPRTMDSLHTVPPREPLPLDRETGKPIVHKTGLGSSAALTTSFCACLFSAFSSFLPQEDTPKLVIHRMAQVAHSLAQGKIGSGFDISSAVFGSVLYSRFPASLLNLLFQEITDKETITDRTGEQEEEEEEKDDGSGVSRVVQLPTIPLCHTLETLLHHSQWSDENLQPFALPASMNMVLADVHGGSSTPSMVRKILAWKKREEESGGECLLWESQKARNAQVSELIHTLTTLCPEEVLEEGLKLLAAHPSSQWQEVASKVVSQNSGDGEGKEEEERDIKSPVLSHLTSIATILSHIRDLFIEVRKGLKDMGDLAGVPVEPDNQTTLADRTANLPGVLAAGVPGAGGNDAIFAIILHPSARGEVERFWLSIEDACVTPLVLTHDPAGLVIS